MNGEATGHEIRLIQRLASWYETRDDQRSPANTPKLWPARIIGSDDSVARLACAHRDSAARVRVAGDAPG